MVLKPSQRRKATLKGWRAVFGWLVAADVVVYSQAQNIGHVRLALVESACDVAISWSVDEPGNQSGLNELDKVGYAHSSAGLSSSTSKSAVGVVSARWRGRRWVRAVLRDLDQDYAYRIGGASGFGPVETRLPSCHWKANSSRLPTTEAAAGGYLRLAVIGDLGFRDNGTADRVLARIQNSTPDAVIQLGDATWDLSGQGSASADFWSKLQPLSSIRPFMPVPGDRDQPEIYQRYFQTSSSSNQPQWYAFTVGYARFLMLWTEALVDLGAATPDWSQRASLAKQQLQWLEEELKRSNTPEAREQQPWVIVAGHRPIYCSLVRPTCSSEAAALRSALEPLFARYEVDLYLASHVHAYERTFRTLNGSVCKTDDSAEASCGPVSIVNGDSAEPPLQYDDMPARFTVQRHPGQPGFGELILRNATVMEYRQLDATTGAVSDQFIILKKSDKQPQEENFLEAVGWLAFATALVTFTCGFVKWVHSDGLKRRDEALRHLRTEIAVLSGMPLKVAGSPIESQHLVGDAASGLH